jgi:hypothetical protein
MLVLAQRILLQATAVLHLRALAVSAADAAASVTVAAAAADLAHMLQLRPTWEITKDAHERLHHAPAVFNC